MATQTTPQTVPYSPLHGATPTAIPPLENGDRLTREEFERRYRAMPHVYKAELIEGVVYMSSPVRYGHHSTPHLNVAYFFKTYELNTPGVEAGLGASVRLDRSNVYQPDAFLFKRHGGQAKISEDDYIELAPELVSEISASTVSIDLHEKFTVYRRNGAKEYLVWRVQDQAIDWFVLRGDQYQPLAPSHDGILRSEAFPGLWLDPAAMIAGDMNRVLEILKTGMATAEHEAFVTLLKENAKS
jgi:Uma2 family endonuclease